jgi:ribosome-binding protein aMBF1 (putative translation factor)
MTDFMRQIGREVKEDHELARLVRQEELILGVTELVLEKLEGRGVSKSQLASMLGTNKSYITQLLRGSRNMTLRTVSDIFFSLDCKLVIKAIPEGQNDRQFVVTGSRLLVCRDQTIDWKEREQPEDVAPVESPIVTVAA